MIKTNIHDLFIVLLEKLGDNTFVVKRFAGINCIILRSKIKFYRDTSACGKTGICDCKMIQFMHENQSNINRVITILIHSYKTLFQNVFFTLLRRIVKDVTLLLLSWHKRYDFNAANFRRQSQ